MAALATLLGLLLANTRSAFLVTANVATNEILDSSVQVSSSAACSGVSACGDVCVVTGVGWGVSRLFTKTSYSPSAFPIHISLLRTFE